MSIDAGKCKSNLKKNNMSPIKKPYLCIWQSSNKLVQIIADKSQTLRNDFRGGWGGGALVY